MVCVNSVNVTPKSITMKVGDWYYDAKATVTPENATCKSVCWGSFNKLVATVNPTTGYIYAKRQGKVKIFARACDGSGAKAYIDVIVEPRYVESIRLSKGYKYMQTSKTFALTATVSPDNATFKSIYWASSNENVAKVDHKGVVTAVSAGTATIRAVAKDGGGAKATCFVRVTDDILVSSIEINASKTTMLVGESMFLKSKAYPENATNKCVCWESADPSIGAINPHNGMLIANSDGEVVITAKACDGSGTIGSLLIEVKKPVDGLRTHTDSYVYVDTVESDEAMLKDANGQNVMLKAASGDIVTLMQSETIIVDSKEFYRILYKGMITYVLAENFSQVVIAEPEFNFEREVTAVPRYNATMNVYSSANDAANVEGSFIYGNIISLVNDVPQRGGWYAVYGKSTDGSNIYGWCDGNYLEFPTLITETATYVRTTPCIDNNNIMKDSNNNLVQLQPEQTARLIKSNTISSDNKEWYEIEYDGGIGYVFAEHSVRSEAGEFLISQAGDLSPLQIHRMLDNIRNCPTSIIPDNRRDAAVSVTLAMVRARYVPTLVAGMIGNIIFEGEPGKFESSNYINNPKPYYLSYMDSEFRGANYYLNNYSGKTVMEVNMFDVRDMVNELRAITNGTGKLNGRSIGFGLGCIQWSFVRTYPLVDLYMYINNCSSVITKEQVVEAETMNIIRELTTTYSSKVRNWENACEDINSNDAAYKAGWHLSMYYVVPSGGETSADIRGTRAQLVYAELIKNLDS